MTDINTFFMIGRVTKDPEIRYTSQGMAKLEISIACNKSVKRGDSWENEVSFFETILWDRKATALKDLLKKGMQVAISGNIKQQRWEKDGKKYSKIAFITEEINIFNASKSSNFYEKTSENFSGLGKMLKNRDFERSLENERSFDDDDIPF